MGLSIGLGLSMLSIPNDHLASLGSQPVQLHFSYLSELDLEVKDGLQEVKKGDNWPRRHFFPGNAT
jgi:hypothetical protein